MDLDGMLYTNMGQHCAVWKQWVMALLILVLHHYRLTRDESHDKPAVNEV